MFFCNSTEIQIPQLKPMNEHQFNICIKNIFKGKVTHITNQRRLAILIKATAY